MKITHRQAQAFINAIKEANPEMKRFACRIQTRRPLDTEQEYKDCSYLFQTDYMDDWPCSAANMRWILSLIFAKSHVNVISIACYTRGRNPELYDHVWLDNAKEQFEKFLKGEPFKTETTNWEL